MKVEKVWFGNCPSPDVASIADVCELFRSAGLPVPIQLKILKGLGERQNAWYGIAEFETKADRQRFLDTKIKWPSGLPCIARLTPQPLWYM